MKMAKKPKNTEKMSRNLANQEYNQEAQNAKKISKKLFQLCKTAKKPKMLKYCLKSLHAKKMSKKHAQLCNTAKKPKILKDAC